MSKTVRLGLAAAVAAFIAGMSLLPVRYKLAVGIAYRVYPFSIFGSVHYVNPHAIAHALAYGGAATVLLPVIRSPWRRAALVLVLALLAFGTEQAQHALYRNRFEWEDIRTDLFALAVAFLAASLQSALQRRPVSQELSSSRPQA